MPFHYQAPHIMPHQETYIEYRVMVPVHEHGLKDVIVARDLPPYLKKSYLRLVK